MNEIKSIEQAQNAISRKLGLSLEDLLSIMLHSLQHNTLSYEEWLDVTKWCLSFEDPIPYRLFSVYLKTMSLRAA